MNLYRYIFLFWSFISFSQTVEQSQDTINNVYYYIEGDNIIKLDEVKLLHKLKFKSRKERITYLILRRKTLKVYPYAKLAAERLEELKRRLKLLKKKRQKKKYAKIIQKYIEGEFSDELKKLTRTEGQILIKLIHRQTGKTAFNLIKELRSGWRAFWFNNTAKLFDISLKREFDPVHIKEDYLIEDILERSFQSGRLVRQKPAIEFDFYDLTKKWSNTNTATK